MMNKWYLLCTVVLISLSMITVLLAFDLLPDQGYTMIWPLSLWAMILHRTGSWLVLMINAGAATAVMMAMRGRADMKSIIMTYWCIIWGTSLLSLLFISYALVHFAQISHFTLSPEIRPSQISATPLYVSLALHTGYVLATSISLWGSIKMQRRQTD